MLCRRYNNAAELPTSATRLSARVPDVPCPTVPASSELQPLCRDTALTFRSRAVVYGEAAVRLTSAAHAALFIAIAYLLAHTILTVLDLSTVGC